MFLFSGAALRFHDVPFSSAIAAEAACRIEGFDPQGLSGTAWALAQLALSEQAFFGAMAEVVPKRAAELGAQEISNIAWACGKLRYQHLPLLDVLSAKGIEILDEFISQHLSNTLWHSPRQVAAISQQAMRKLPILTPQDLCSTAWCLAILELQDWTLLEAICGAALPKLKACGAQGVANLVWSCATVLYVNMPLIDAIAHECLETQIQHGHLTGLAGASTQDISSTAWSFAKQGYAGTSFFEALALHLPSRIFQFGAQEISNTVWAFATLVLSAEPMLAVVAEAVLPKLCTWRQQELANSVWAFARLCFLNEELMTGIADRLLVLRSSADVGSFTVQEMVNTVWAYAQVMFCHEKLLESIAETAIQHSSEWHPRDLANTI
eukprot:symbB.v1.2.026719.t1/scaffold2644.1/size74222/7